MMGMIHEYRRGLDDEDLDMRTEESFQYRKDGERKKEIVNKRGNINKGLIVLHDYNSKSGFKEVTQLYRSANQLIKTLYAARTAMLMGDDNRAILSYSEVARLFISRGE